MALVLLQHVLAFLFSLLCLAQAHGLLTFDHYRFSCPNAELVIRQAVSNAVNSNSRLAAALLRLEFHDCFVNGCDGSVLIDSTPGNIAEKDAPANNPSLKGFEVIDAAKSAVESVCPATVSCADILAFAARDSVVLAGGPYFDVRSGRKDGTLSSDIDAIQNLPSASFNLQQLTQIFAHKGLTQDEMVTLSGAHTIGASHCSGFINRLHNFNSLSGGDPTLDPNFAQQLKALCPPNPDPNALIDMDITPATFDTSYYGGVLRQRGLFSSDAALLSSPFTSHSVQRNAADRDLFFHKFADAMIRMIEIEVKTGPQGEIRQNCRVING